jgi:NTP pyrophosphatase (non-canonical NTP hydrolase)
MSTRTETDFGPLNGMAAEIHGCAVAHGWWDGKGKRNVPEMLCLVHSEVSEALEAYRNWNDENFREELADIIIRVLDMAAGYQIDIAKEVARKHDVNICRPHRHGGKRC